MSLLLHKAGLKEPTKGNAAHECSDCEIRYLNTTNFRFQMFSPFKCWRKRFSSPGIFHPLHNSSSTLASSHPLCSSPSFPKPSNLSNLPGDKTPVCNAVFPNSLLQLGSPHASPAPEDADSPRGVLGRRDQRQPRSPSASSRRAHGSRHRGATSPELTSCLQVAAGRASGAIRGTDLEGHPP